MKGVVPTHLVIHMWIIVYFPGGDRNQLIGRIKLLPFTIDLVRHIYRRISNLKSSNHHTVVCVEQMSYLFYARSI